MRKLVIVTVITTIFYLMTGLVFFEGSFAGALVVKPYPTHQVAFGGGEEGIWSRYHPGEPIPWFMQKDLKVIFSFDWEQGRPAWIDAYLWGYLAMVFAWVALAPIGAVKLIVRIRARLYSPPLSIR
jgi:hypothetical protein